MKKYTVTLTEDERSVLGVLTSKGNHKSQKILNALILLGCDAGRYQIKRSTNEEISSCSCECPEYKHEKDRSREEAKESRGMYC